MFPFQTLFGQRLLLGQHSRIMTADVPFVNFPSFSFENANQTPSRTCSDTVCWVWNQIQLAQRATCALNAPLRDCCEAEGWAFGAPGSCAALGALLYLFCILGFWVGCHWNRELWSWEVWKPVALCKPSSHRWRKGTQGFWLMAGPCPLFQGRQPSCSSKTSLPLCGASVYTSLCETVTSILQACFGN